MLGVKIDHPDPRIIKIGKNTEKNPEDLMKLSVTQIPMKNHQQSPVWKTQSKWKNNNEVMIFKQIA